MNYSQMGGKTHACTQNISPEQNHRPKSHILEMNGNLFQHMKKHPNHRSFETAMFRDGFVKLGTAPSSQAHAVCRKKLPSEKALEGC